MDSDSEQVPSNPTRNGVHQLKTTLVKFDKPILYVCDSNFAVKQQSTKLPPLDRGVSHSYLPPQNGELSVDLPTEIVETLDMIKEPKLFHENGKTYIRRLSREASSRDDVIHLGKELDMHLKARRAKDCGICPVRRQLHTEFFDELIRQVCLTAQSKERTLLLIKVRDEMNMTLKSYEALLDSAVSKFATEIISNSQSAMIELKEKIEAAEIDNKNLLKGIEQLETHFEESELAHNGITTTVQQHHDEQMEHLKSINLQSTLHLDELTRGIKKHETIKP